MERTLIAPGVHLSCDPAEKFNRCRISIHFAFPAQRATATAHALLPLVLALVHHNRTFAVQKPAERKAVFAMLCLTSFVILQGAGLYATFQMPS